MLAMGAQHPFWVWVLAVGTEHPCPGCVLALGTQHPRPSWVLAVGTGDGYWRWVPVVGAGGGCWPRQGRPFPQQPLEVGVHHQVPARPRLQPGTNWVGLGERPPWAQPVSNHRTGVPWAPHHAQVPPELISDSLPRLNPCATHTPGSSPPSPAPTHGER